MESNTVSFINLVTTVFAPDGTGEVGFTFGESSSFTISDVKFSNGCSFSKTFNFESNEHNFNIVPNPSSDNTIRFTRLLESCNISIFKIYPDTLITINHNNSFESSTYRNFHKITAECQRPHENNNTDGVEYDKFQVNLYYFHVLLLCNLLVYYLLN